MIAIVLAMRVPSLSRRQALATLGAAPLCGISACVGGEPSPHSVTGGHDADELSRLGPEYERLMGRHGYAEWARYAGEADPKVDAERQMKELREAEGRVVKRAAQVAASTASVDPREAAAWKRAALGLDLLGDPTSAALADKLEAVLNDHVFEHEGRKVTRGDLRKMARGDDPKLRRDQHRLYGGLHAKAAPIARDLLRRRRDVARERGLGQGFYDALLELRGVSPQRLRALFGELEQGTREAYGRALADATAAAKLKKAAPWDSAFLTRQFDYLPDERFPKEQAIPFARAVYGALGV